MYMFKFEYSVADHEMRARHGTGDGNDEARGDILFGQALVRDGRLANVVHLVDLSRIEEAVCRVARDDGAVQQASDGNPELWSHHIFRHLQHDEIRA